MAKKPERRPLNIISLVDTNKIDVTKANRRSMTWYNKQVQELSRWDNDRSREILIRGRPSGLGRRSKAQQGFMYLFGYEAKYADVLPYWDRFPMVLPFATDNKGFTGFNIHYLPYRTRSIILQRILEFATNERMDYSTRVKISWKLVKNFAKIEALSFCVKRYLWTHVKTNFRQVPPEDWGLVALLPIHNFEGAKNPAKVWADTLSKGIR